MLIRGGGFSLPFGSELGCQEGLSGERKDIGGGISKSHLRIQGAISTARPPYLLDEPRGRVDLVPGHGSVLVEPEYLFV